MSRKSMNSINQSFKEEDKAIKEAIITPYEKVMKILRKVQTYLGSNELAKEVNWVIQIIHSQNLYSYQGLSNMALETNKNNSFEIKSLLGYLDAYSEGHNTFSNNLTNKRSHTTMHKKQFISPFLSKFRQETAFEEEPPDAESSDFLVFDEQSNDSINDIKKEEMDIKEESKANNGNNLNDIDSHFPNEKTIVEFKAEEIGLLEEFILNFRFNPFEFYSQYGKADAFFKGAYCLFNKFRIQLYSSESIMQNFITEIKDNYLSIPYYHTEMHGLDVCQTIAMYLLQTNVRKHLQLNQLDVVSLVIAGLVHDVGHPGFNNDYQVKMQTDLAVNYNDKNVLENYHTALTFQIIKNDSRNIFSQLPMNEFHYIRKRMIELILSTDMLFHSRICVLMKNRLEVNHICNGKNCEMLISSSSESLFEEQQEVMNFLIHTADISHTSKDFKVSYQWTKLLTEEFWRQGDEEKKNGLKVAFIFDRANSDIHRSQIGFIKGIILPLFDLVSHFLPELKVYTDNVHINLKEWARLSSEKDKE